MREIMTAAELREHKASEHGRDYRLSDDGDWACDVIHEIADEATDYLQGLAPEGYWFEWDAGELCLVRDDEDEGYERGQEH